MSEWVNTGEIDLPEGFHDRLPKPVFWRLLVMPQAPEEVTAGGIVLTQTNRDAQMYNTYVGKVLGVGPLVGKRSPINEADFPVEEGTWVVYGKYAGQRVEVDGVRLVFLNDEDILGITDQPKALKTAV